METATIILPVTEHLPTNIINYIIKSYESISIPLNIIISHHGKRHDKQDINAIVVEREYNGDFSLSKTRNAGAWASNSKWLIFSDADTTYENDVFARMIAIGKKAVAGKSRRDIFVDSTGDYYQCGFAPLLILREFFEEVGGYSEKFVNYGFEDSHFEHKIIDNLFNYDSKANHIMSIHNIMANLSTWKRGDDNRKLFLDEMNIPLQDRIAFDHKFYFENKAKHRI